MTRHHARKHRARRTARATGSAYTSAHAGTLHHHPGPDFFDVDGKPFGVSREADMKGVTALIGAQLAGCKACRARAMDSLLEGDALVLAVLVASTPLQTATRLESITRLCGHLAVTRKYELLLETAASVEDIQRVRLLEDLIGTWTGLLPGLHPWGDMHDRAVFSGAVSVDLTPPEQPQYRLGAAGFLPTPAGPFPSLTLSSVNFTGSIEDLAQRCAFQPYSWNTLPDPSPTWWLQQQTGATALPYGLVRRPRHGPSDALGTVDQPLQVTAEWLDAVSRAGSALVLGTWTSSLDSVVHAVREGEIVAVRARARR